MRGSYWIGLLVSLALAAHCRAGDSTTPIANRTAAPAIAGEPDWRDLLATGKQAYGRGEFAAALAKLEPALDGAQREQGADSKDLIEILDQLGMTQRELGNHAAAEAAFRRQLALNEAAYGKKSVAYVENLLDLGQTFSDRGDDKLAAPLTDPTETLALKHVFGDHAPRLQVSSTKGYYGHALGASGAFEAAICALALERRWLPPTVNLECPDESCDLDYIPNEGRAADVEYALSNSFGFGGINAALVFRRAD